MSYRIEENRNICSFIKVFMVITAKLLTDDATCVILTAHGGDRYDIQRKLCKKDNGIH